MGITRVHTNITRLHRSITRLHRGITIIHTSAARWRRRRIVDPVHAAFIKGLGDTIYSDNAKSFLQAGGLIQNLLSSIRLFLLITTC